MKNKPHSRSLTSSPSPAPGRRNTATERREAALEIGVAALTFIAGAPSELARFLALTGIEAGAIRAAAAEPRFLEGVLAYIGGNERTLLSFAESANIPPQEVENARLTLAGADSGRQQT
jgi:hypothetical protein